MHACIFRLVNERRVTVLHLVTSHPRASLLSEPDTQPLKWFPRAALRCRQVRSKEETQICYCLHTTPGKGFEAGHLLSMSNADIVSH